ncbi:OB-fold-containig protein [Rhodopirellula bahusiensis]|uniref:DUF1449 domain-containing protein n=1 Tax=Rhodopirellula bahusiensis TaxID=2014065 RepID=A0A2G1W3R5_9BACT|nr:OB-fold-containig protein [Rhodopirellula bahusiensis]PHQ33663.1 DUF1449 domain-containing protein [Rhodopirellula bahusiensis]
MLAMTWTERLDSILVGPMWPATVLAALFLLYALVSMLGIFEFGVDADVDVDLDIPDLDAPDLAGDVGGDLGMDASGEPMHGDWFGGAGAATLRAMNLDRVPLVVWFSVFSVLFWVISFYLWFGYDVRRYDPDFLTSGLLTIRNGVLGIVATKMATWPLHRIMVPPTEFHASSLVGGSATIETRQADESFGRARFATDAAPLLISVRTGGEIIPKGVRVTVVNYDQNSKTYLVRADSSAST